MYHLTPFLVFLIITLLAGMSATEQTFYANHQLLSYRTDMKHRSYMYAVRHKNPPILRTRGSTKKLRISDKWIPRYV
jgi:hypothetical protein